MRRINDIFYSLQGEGYNTGRAAVFVRFAGCNLRCPFCDTEFDTHREMTDDEIVAEISRYEVRDARYENSMEADSSIGSNLAPRTIPDVPSPTRSLSHLAPRHLYLQPCDTGDAERNARIINRCVEYIKEHPHWRLSLQTHKLVGFK